MSLPKRSFSEANPPQQAYPVHMLTDTIYKRPKPVDDETDEPLEDSISTTTSLASVGQATNRIISDPGYKDKSVTQGPLDPIFGQRRAFPITIDIDSVDLTKTPENVNEYLAMVRLEAQQYDDSLNNDDGSNIESDFEEKENDNPENNEQEIQEPKAVLTKEEIDLLLTKYQDQRSVYQNYRMGITELDAIDLPTTQKAWKFFIFNNEPSLDLVAQIFEEKEHIKLIIYFTKWLNIDVNIHFEQWLMQIMAGLEDLLDNSDISIVRSLGKKAKKQLTNELNSRNENIMKMILVITGRFYGQRDLLL
ncbi:hypothetical protein CANARDRAFT_6936 [[Candida] arabinofermentans NRRL YB-2248]|uniref:Uncharacterized protein n=1 Tax=[Candida] arabinofermentans NRRL YB-2248 TaxID=983967 RepID=A0A1E4T3X8_9ASCO|nr:hypothetical protein CANARDRAFT_6936 [[Candida] arabinofermentans NRRL YB-2248]